MCVEEREREQQHGDMSDMCPNDPSRIMLDAEMKPSIEGERTKSKGSERVEK